MSDARVVLLKPGDVLVIGNLGSIDTAAALKAMEEIKTTLRLSGVAAFQGDINLAAVAGPQSISGPDTTGALGPPEPPAEPLTTAPDTSSSE